MRLEGNTCADLDDSTRYDAWGLAPNRSGGKFTAAADNEVSRRIGRALGIP